MKKLSIILLAPVMLALAACGGNAGTQDRTEAQSRPAAQNEAPVSDAPTPVSLHEWTLEELGEKIVAAGTFWTDLWYFTGIFAHENLDFSHPEPPFHIIMNGVRVLPGSGFSSLDDIADFLLQFYTQNRVRERLSAEAVNGLPSFAEYNGNLFAYGTRAGFSMPDWSRATHELLEQANGHAIVKTTVPHGAWHRTDLDEINYVLVEYMFTFEDGRISSSVEIPFVPEPWPAFEVFVESFTEEHLDSFNRHFPFDYREVLYARDGVWWEGVYGEQISISFNRPVWHFEILLLSNDFMNDQFSFAVLKRFPVAELLWTDEAIFAWDYFEHGTLPWSGFSFEVYDEDEDRIVRRYFFLQINQGYPETGGFWIFREFVPYTGEINNIQMTSSESNLVWLVEPTLEYDFIYHCCFFSTGDHSGDLIDSTTGLIIEWPPDLAFGHGPLGRGWVYDPNLSLLGFGGIGDYSGIDLRTIDEWMALFAQWGERHRLMMVQSVDSSLRDITEAGSEFLSDEAHSGKFAVMTFPGFVTDFIFDGGNVSGGAVHEYDTIAMHIGDAWGLIDRNGNVAVPFIFEHIVRIDAETAFARYNGRYGILNIPLTIANF